MIGLHETVIESRLRGNGQWVQMEAEVVQWLTSPIGGEVKDSKCGGCVLMNTKNYISFATVS